MKDSLLLKCFEYSNFDSLIDVNETFSQYNHSLEMQLPLTKTKIDFEHKDIYLEGYGILIRSHNHHMEMKVSAFNRDIVRVRATINHCFQINLSDFSKDGLVFMLEGAVDDGKGLHSCAGTLVLCRHENQEGERQNEWDVTAYLYDDYNDKREVKLKLTVCLEDEKAQLVFSKTS